MPNPHTNSQDLCKCEKEREVTYRPDLDRWTCDICGLLIPLSEKKRCQHGYPFTEENGLEEFRELWKKLGLHLGYKVEARQEAIEAWILAFGARREEEATKRIVAELKQLSHVLTEDSFDRIISQFEALTNH